MDPMGEVVVTDWLHHPTNPDPCGGMLDVKLLVTGSRHGEKKAHSPLAKLSRSAHMTTTANPRFSSCATSAGVGSAVVKNTFFFV